jgi:hypothetical protein
MQLWLKVSDVILTGYKITTYLINVVRLFVFQLKITTLVLLMFNFMILASNQPYISSIPDRSTVKSSAVFIARKNSDVFSLEKVTWNI